MLSKPYSGVMKHQHLFLLSHLVETARTSDIFTQGQSDFLSQDQAICTLLLNAPVFEKSSCS